MFDGNDGIKIRNSTNIEIKSLEIVGPALRITGEEATINRARRAGIDETYACGGHDSGITEAECNNKD